MTCWIMASVGPNFRDIELVDAMLCLGVTRFRFALSKGPVAQQERMAITLHERARVLGIRPEIQLFVDVPGGKPRTDNPEPLPLAAGQLIRLSLDEPRRPGCDLGVRGWPLDHGPSPIRPGEVLILGDGELALEVREGFTDVLEAFALREGVLGPHRGVAIAGRHLPTQSLTDADRRTLASIDASLFSGLIASFVERPGDLQQVRACLAPGDRERFNIFAKLETRAGIEAPPNTWTGADAVLVGRGDLLLDVGEVEFKSAIDSAIDRLRLLGLPVIVGTQLLTTMSDNWLPHRSELAELSRLIAGGVDGLLLANETTVGKAPLRVVELLNRLIERYTT